MAARKLAGNRARNKAVGGNALRKEARVGVGTRTGDNARSGPNIPNDQRHTAQVLLRLPPDVADELRTLGAEHEGGISGWVAARVRAALARKA